jgi:FkbM family methyltransferase
MPAVRLLASTRAGTVSCDPRDGVQSTLLEHGEWEPTVSRTIARILRPGDVFMDIGANIGYFSLLASGIVGERGLVIAFEPLWENVACLFDTCSRNHADNILCLSLALNDVSRLVTLHLSGDGQVGLTSLRPLGTQTRRVLSCRLDGIMDESIFANVRLIKLDVEGAEMNVVTGMAGLFERGHRPFVICEVTDGFARSLGSSASMLVQRFASYDYQLFGTHRQGDQSWAPLDPLDVPTEQFDMLCVPPGVDSRALLAGGSAKGC